MNSRQDAFWNSNRCAPACAAVTGIAPYHNPGLCVKYAPNGSLRKTPHGSDFGNAVVPLSCYALHMRLFTILRHPSSGISR